MEPEKEIQLKISQEFSGKRIDQALALLLPDFSRSRLKSWIDSGHVLRNGKPVKPKDKVFADDNLDIQPPNDEVKTEDEPQNIPLDVLMEHGEFLVINKAAGLVVHPAAGNWKGTLVNALLHHYPELERLPRAGIVHRLDKDTSGCLLVARSVSSYNWYVQLLKERQVSRQYLAVVQGVMIGGATVDAPIGRSPRDRKKMAVVAEGKEAITHYRLREKFKAHTLVEVHLETGRTHQIRVHLAHKRFPLVGDSVYGNRILLPKGCSEELRVALQSFPRQALHAEKLSFTTHKEEMEIECKSPVPDDINGLLSALRKFSDQ